jgi:hypothetical protein
MLESFIHLAISLAQVYFMIGVAVVLIVSIVHLAFPDDSEFTAQDYLVFLFLWVFVVYLFLSKLFNGNRD